MKVFGIAVNVVQQDLVTLMKSVNNIST